MERLFWLIFIIWYSNAELKASKVSGVSCIFKDKRYSPGESWHPYLEPFGFMFCMRCVCTEIGHVKCNTIKCPALPCENPVTDPQQCCPRCMPTDEPRIPAGLRASVKFCRYNGSIYQPGETFTKHDRFSFRQTNQCVLCTCSNGNIFCALKTCQTVTCATPTSVPDTCCLLCKDHGNSGASSNEDGNQQLNRGVRHSVDQCAAEPLRAQSDRATSSMVRSMLRGVSLNKLNLKGAADTTVKIIMQKIHQRACLYNGRTYSHGDMWHPVLGKVLECILCTCSDGMQNCKRITCPSHYPCRRPMKPVGKCCKICPEIKDESNQTQCLRGYKNNLVVYKATVVTPDTGKTIAIERESTTDVELQVWNVIEGVLRLTETREMEKKDILDHPENYTLLTTLDEETWRTFKEDNLSEVSSTICEDSIREIMEFLNPKHIEGLCSP